MGNYTYQPQNLGQMGRMSWTLKDTLTKLTLETGGGWEDLFKVLHPFKDKVLRTNSYLRGFTPFEIRYVLCPRVQEDVLAEISDQTTLQSLQTLQVILSKIHIKCKDSAGKQACSSLQLQPQRPCVDLQVPGWNPK